MINKKLFVCVSVCLSVCVSVCLYICLSCLYLSIWLSVYLPVYLVKQTKSSTLIPRFMVDTGVVGCNWIELPAAKYYQVKENNKLSACQYEVECGWRDMVSLSTEGEWGQYLCLFVCLSVCLWVCLSVCFRVCL